LVAILGIAACGEETPVGLPGLLPGGGTATAEVILDAADFLAWDSVRTGFYDPGKVSFVVAAGQYDGGLDVHGLYRFQGLPENVSYQDTLGVFRVDTLPALTGGRFEFQLDTMRTISTGPITVSLYQLEESWDVGSADWLSRVDTGSVRLAWTEPGGTRGDLIDTAHLVPGDSVLAFQVDSATLALWRDREIHDRGVMIQVETPESRIELGSAFLHFKAYVSAQPDTMVTDSVGIQGRTFLLSHEPDPGKSLVIGGTPTWRSYLHFKDRLDTISVPCPGDAPGCVMKLSEAMINYAGLELQRVPAPPGFALVDSARYESRTVLNVEGVPLARLPLGISFGGIMTVPPASAANGSESVNIPVTPLMSALASADTAARHGAPTTMALLGYPEGDGMGLAAFGSLASGPLAPRLRLIYSVLKEVQVQ
jgi:hypothetical protein